MAKELTFKACLKQMSAAYERQTDFAKALGISPQYLSDLMSGRRSPHPSLCDKLAIGSDDRVSRTLHRLGARAVGWRV